MGILWGIVRGPTRILLWSLLPVHVIRPDGYFNMTKAAKEFGKLLTNFWSNEGTWIYIEALVKREGKLHGIPCSSLKTPEIERRKLLKQVLVETSAGTHGGTWAHPRLATKFACWLDPAFEVECMYMIDEILKGNLIVTQQPAQVEPEHSAMSRLMSAAVDVMRGLLATMLSLRPSPLDVLPAAHDDRRGQCSEHPCNEHPET